MKTKTLRTPSAYRIILQLTKWLLVNSSTLTAYEKMLIQDADAAITKAQQFRNQYEKK